MSLDQNPESNRITICPAAPARRARAMVSSMNRRVPRAVFAEPLRIRACSTSPVSARVANSGCYVAPRIMALAKQAALCWCWCGSWLVGVRSA